MTIEERNSKLKHLITCLKCEVSGKCCDDNCPIQYEAGNMGEIIENLEAISKVLEQKESQPKTGHWINTGKISFYNYNLIYKCSQCNCEIENDYDNYCKKCGAKMINLD